MSRPGAPARIRPLLLTLPLLLFLLQLAACASLSGLREKPEVTLAGLALREAGLVEQRWA